MAAIKRNALWPQVAELRPSSLNASDLIVDRPSSTRSQHAFRLKPVIQIDLDTEQS
jgi:hypothetical protein